MSSLQLEFYLFIRLTKSPTKIEIEIKQATWKMSHTYSVQIVARKKNLTKKMKIEKSTKN